MLGDYTDSEIGVEKGLALTVSAYVESSDELSGDAILARANRVNEAAYRGRGIAMVLDPSRLHPGRRYRTKCPLTPAHDCPGGGKIQ